MIVKTNCETDGSSAALIKFVAMICSVGGARGCGGEETMVTMIWMMMKMMMIG